MASTAGWRDGLTTGDGRFSDTATTFHVARLAGLWRVLLDRALRPHDMTLATMRPLAYLMMLPDGISQRELALAMNADTSTLVRVLDGLERDALIERRPAPTDRRTNQLHLTPAGRQAGAQFQEIAAALERRLLAGIEAEAPRLNTLMARLLSNAEALPDA
ncbi:MarR family winged helix-turn-helix transcriptional regulator [Acidomonas methanolica]|uniref:MarR family winged helix-turn-helix transcriptional regulator n=1 Tax=Acidomonas methanolica TaxID=437 RepID=UPI00211A82C4|nr:MarR family transcriptional regulator [Acidomonas methanolica]MCQ9156139.1 MarR family transcriptional regulator [Acidomonas methanolica]